MKRMSWEHRTTHTEGSMLEDPVPPSRADTGVDEEDWELVTALCPTGSGTIVWYWKRGVLASPATRLVDYKELLGIYEGNDDEDDS
jgi:hypothetical protein